MNEEEIISKIINAAFKVHKKIGPGMLESIYEKALGLELQHLGLFFETQKPVELIYEEVNLGLAFRADMIVEGKIVIELKSVESLAPIHHMQAFSYLKCLGLRYALLINFNSYMLKDGLKRIVH
jgi:GxxExxY protein